MLGAAQIDARGDINSTWSPGGDDIVGSGGANDVASAAEEVIAVVKHSPRRLIEKVGYDRTGRKGVDDRDVRSCLLTA